MTDADPTRDHRPTDPAGLRPGQVLGRCRIERILGTGAMGTVYRAQHEALGTTVAVKVLHPGLDARPEIASRFVREGRLAARIRHPNVLTVLDAGRDAATGLHYMICEFAPGGSIQDRLDRGPLDEDEALAVAAQVARALEAADRLGIVHRDVKPANLLRAADGRVQLADLGLARQTAAADLTGSHHTMGTPGYMSPEQIHDPRRVDVRSDLYALGATLYHLLTGRPPFEGDNVFNILHQVVNDPAPDPRDLRPDLSDRASRICRRLLEKDPDARYPSPAALLAELEEATGPRPTPGRPARRRRPSIAIALAVGVLLAVALAVVVAGRPGPATPDAGAVLPPSMADGLELALTFEPATGDGRSWRDARPAGPRLAGAARAAPGGPAGQAAAFDGTSDHLTLTGQVAIRSIALRFRIDGPAMTTWLHNDRFERLAGLLIGSYDAAASPWDTWRARGGTGVYIGLFAVDVLIPLDDLDGIWHQLVVAIDGDEVRVVLDGRPADGVVADGNRATPGRGGRFALPAAADTSPSGRLVLGRLEADWWPGEPFFAGALDEVAIWSRPLDLDEMTAFARWPGRAVEDLAGSIRSSGP